VNLGQALIENSVTSIDGEPDPRIKSLNNRTSLTCEIRRKPHLTCGLLSRLFPTVHGHFWLARGFFVELIVGRVSGSDKNARRLPHLPAPQPAPIGYASRASLGDP
jgi:hypothetical protein